MREWEVDGTPAGQGRVVHRAMIATWTSSKHGRARRKDAMLYSNTYVFVLVRLFCLLQLTFQLECCNQLECDPNPRPGEATAAAQHDHPRANLNNGHTPNNTPIFSEISNNMSWMVGPTQPYTPSSTLPSPTALMSAPAPPIVPTHICHWQNCHRVFNSMPDLLGHVAADHLGAPGFLNEADKPLEPIEPPPQQIVPPAQAQPQPLLLSDSMVQAFTAGALSQQPMASSSNTTSIDHDNDPLASMLSGQQNPFGQDPGQELLSCLWDDCLPLPECTAPAPEECPTHSQMPAHPIGGHSHTNASGEPFSPQTMLRHVLEEHLGVPGAILGWGDAHGPNNSSSTQAIPIASTDPDAVAKAHERLHHHHHHIHLPTPSSTHQSPSPPPVKPLICLWPGCSHPDPFPDPGSLMAHLSDCHVGKGRDSYTCQWDNCDRTFRSRQKVLRHLQSHTGHRPFVCPVCEQAFGEAAPLAAHMRRHAQESECFSRYEYRS
jgi:hypothetical protein